MLPETAGRIDFRRGARMTRSRVPASYCIYCLADLDQLRQLIVTLHEQHVDVGPGELHGGAHAPPGRL